MSAILATALSVGASLSGGTAFALAVTARRRRMLAARRKAIMFQNAKGQDYGLEECASQELPTRKQAGSWVLTMAEGLTRRLYIGTTEPLSPAVRKKRAAKSRSGLWFKAKRTTAGLVKSVSPAAFCELRVRLMLAGVLAGALLGATLSTELALGLGVLAGFAGYRLPVMAVNQSIKQRASLAEGHLSEMLEIVALGLRSGLTFDRSFALYGVYFSNGFALSCTRAYRSWTLGLSSREEALRELADSYAVPSLSRIMDSIIRSLRFGTPFAGLLEEASAQARATCKAALEERVAKAPVKMMLPTGTLILPAMLLLILGPVLLELASGF